MKAKYKIGCWIVGGITLVSLVGYNYYIEKQKQYRFNEIADIANLGMDALEKGDREVANEYQAELLAMGDLNDYNVNEVEQFFHQLETYTYLESLSRFDITGFETLSEEDLEIKKDELIDIYLLFEESDPTYEEATKIYNEKMMPMQLRSDQFLEEKKQQVLAENEKQAYYEQYRGTVKLSETSTQTTYRICMNRYGELNISGYFSSSSYYDSLNVTVYDQSNNIVGVYCNDEILPGDGFRFDFDQSYTLNDGIYTVVVTRNNPRVEWQINTYGNLN